MEERRIAPGELYRHNKGGLYQIVTIATHWETGQELVIYQELYGGFKVYAQPLDRFLDEMDYEKRPADKTVCSIEKMDGKANEKNDCGNEGDDVTENEEGQVNPDLMDFLNARTYREKIEILTKIKKSVDDRILDNMAVSLDFVLPEGNTQQKFEALLGCLHTFEKYELRRRL